ncbi:ATP-binding protein [uncultured Ruthenibacterium sp.]|uniref:ATP-binding protein n=1 Tax=uncultured Ruthenibacterium sp. TaxID=1905347 RepID=UPI00349EBF15
MTRQEMMHKAFGIVSSRRQKAITLADQRLAAVQKDLPELTQLEQQRALAGLRAAQLSASGAERAQIDAALAEASACDAKRDMLLRENGIDPASLAPEFTCPICKDTGRVSSGPCECVLALVREMCQKEVNESSPLSLCSFSTFDLNKYPDRYVPELGLSARQHMEDIFHYCKDYAEQFTLKNPNLYLYGYAGLGKTHLALAIANTVLHKGFNVVYISAQNAFDAMEKEHFRNEEANDTLATLCDAQLLILDDLGTEYLTPYVSSCLYSLVNTRMCRCLPTIYTSNIVLDADLQRRYTEKIVSRLLGNCECLNFCGDDVRLMDK